jgi:hypothetical protein
MDFQLLGIDRIVSCMSYIYLKISVTVINSNFQVHLYSSSAKKVHCFFLLVTLKTKKRSTCSRVPQVLYGTRSQSVNCISFLLFYFLFFLKKINVP